MDAERASILGIDTQPDADGYHANTDRDTHTEIEIVPDTRTVRVYQAEDMGSVPVEVGHGLLIVRDLDCRPDAEALEEYLESDDAQDLLAAVCDGWSEWRLGRDQGGRLDKSAEEALAKLLDNIRSLPESDWTRWQASDWLYEADVPADKDDGELADLARRCEREAARSHVILTGDCEVYLREKRQTAREEAGWRQCRTCEAWRPDCMQCSVCETTACKECRQAGWTKDVYMGDRCPACPEVVFIDETYFSEGCGGCPERCDGKEQCPNARSALASLIQRCEDEYPHSTIEVMPQDRWQTEIAARNYRSVTEPPDEWYDECW